MKKRVGEDNPTMGRFLTGLFIFLIILISALAFIMYRKEFG